MENIKTTCTICEQNKLGDEDLGIITGGTGAQDAPQHQNGEIVYIVMNQIHN